LNLLERAKGYIASKASKIAMVAVPLAALAINTVPAQAGGVSGVSFNSSSCAVFAGLGSCSSDQVSPSGGNPSANWLELFTANPVISSGGVQLFVSGGATGSFSSAQTVPISWDFFVSGPNGGTVNWDLLFQINTTASGSSTFSIDPSGTAAITSGSGTEVQGSSSLLVPASNVTGYELFLTVNDPNFDPFSVMVPGGGTIDLNGQLAAPEPSSLLLALPGLAAFLLRRRKKQA
jgi:hypothetical protein